MGDINNSIRGNIRIWYQWQKYVEADAHHNQIQHTHIHILHIFKLLRHLYNFYCHICILLFFNFLFYILFKHLLTYYIYIFWNQWLEKSSWVFRFVTVRQCDVTKGEVTTHCVDETQDCPGEKWSAKWGRHSNKSLQQPTKENAK